MLLHPWQSRAAHCRSSQSTTTAPCLTILPRLVVTNIAGGGMMNIHNVAALLSGHMIIAKRLTFGLGNHTVMWDIIGDDQH